MCSKATTERYSRQPRWRQRQRIASWGVREVALVIHHPESSFRVLLKAREAGLSEICMHFSDKPRRLLLRPQVLNLCPWGRDSICCRATGRQSDGEWRAVTPGPAEPCAAPTGATLRALCAAPYSTARSAMQRRKVRRARNCLCKPFPASCVRGVGCSVYFSVPGVMDRLKGRRGPTIFLAEEPKKS